MTATTATPTTTSAAETFDRDDQSWSRMAIMGRLLRFGRPLWGVLGLNVAFRIMQMSLGIALFGVGAWGVGNVLDNGPDTAIRGVVTTMVVIAFVKGLFRYVEQFCGHFVAFKLLALMRDDFYAKVEPQAPAGLAGKHTGDLLARVMKDIDRVEVFYAHTIAPALAATIVPIIAVITLGVGYGWIHALVLAPFLVAVGLVIPLLSNGAASKAATDLRVARGSMSQHVTDTIQGVREVLAFGHEDRRVEELMQLDHAAADSQSRMARMMAMRRGLNELFVGAGIATGLLVSASRISDGALTWAEAGVILAVTILSFGPVLGVEEFIADLEQSFAGARRIWEITDRPPMVADGSIDLKSTADLRPEIVIEGVKFTYPSDVPDLTPPAVDGVSLVVPSGSRVAIVGASGSGKSTLVSLLLRFWDVDGGSISVGGHDIRELTLGSLRELISVVDQRTYLFNDTVATNLRLAKPDATQSELESACKRAAIHDTIMLMEEGYDTMVGEMGERLSGGQRQRLAIARALLKDSPILVLDEATSQLDVHTEAEIQADLDKLAEGRTVLTVAHRLSTIRDADTIFVMDQAKVVEVGTHVELLAAQGAYAQLWSRQVGEL